MIYTLKRTQTLSTTIDEVWAFMSSPENLVQITPGFLSFELLGQPPENIHPGLIIHYKLRPVLKLKMHWTTEITHVNAPHFFVDTQLKGPYTIWHHQHHFKEHANGVDMVDEVNYALPVGILGRAAHSLFVKRQLRQIFDYREKKISEIFGEA